jgi:hypothetical protein
MVLLKHSHQSLEKHTQHQHLSIYWEVGEVGEDLETQLRDLEIALGGVVVGGEVG